MESTLTSKVPPPRSKITTLDPAIPESWVSFFPWRPYAKAAAVGSLMIRRTSSPCETDGAGGKKGGARTNQTPRGGAYIREKGTTMMSLCCSRCA